MEQQWNLQKVVAVTPHIQAAAKKPQIEIAIYVRISEALLQGPNCIYIRKVS